MLEKDQDSHKKENAKIMSENVYLLFEINAQRKECHALEQKIRDYNKQIDKLQGGLGDDNLGDADTGLQQELNIQDMQIAELSR